MDNLFLDLKGYRIYFDGTVEAHDPEKTHELLLLGLKPAQVSTKELTEDLALHNSLVDDNDEKISLSHNAEQIVDAITPELYRIPVEYLNINLREFTLAKYRALLSGEPESQIALDRINTELEEINKRGIENLFKTIIYVVDRFKESGTVFGVGRGSSCACFILYLLGLNLVNPLKYDIPIDEFFH
jgi:DNA polymerase-3 subunit alpha